MVPQRFSPNRPKGSTARFEGRCKGQCGCCLMAQRRHAIALTRQTARKLDLSNQQFGGHHRRMNILEYRGYRTRHSNSRKPMKSGEVVTLANDNSAEEFAA
jgi:hypothetical protein